MKMPLTKYTSQKYTLEKREFSKSKLARHSQYTVSQNIKGHILPKSAVLNKHLRFMSGKFILSATLGTKYLKKDNNFHDPVHLKKIFF